MMGSDAVIFSVMGLSAVIGGTSVWVTMALRQARRAASQQAVPPSAEVMVRFDRLELALDSVAVEVERIGEAERFATKLLAARSEGLLPPPSRDAREAATTTPH